MGQISTLQSRKPLVSAKITDWVIVCVMEIAGLYAWNLGKEEKHLCFSMIELVTQNPKEVEAARCMWMPVLVELSYEASSALTIIMKSTAR